jgi:hypothetical protein
MQPAIQSMSLMCGKDKEICGVLSKEPEDSGGRIRVSDGGFTDTDAQICDRGTGRVRGQHSPASQCITHGWILRPVGAKFV